MATDTVNLEISKEIVKPIVEAKVNAAIIEALNGHEQLIEAAVARVLSTKVDSKGNPDTYGYSSSITFMQWLCKDAITAAAREAIREWITQNRQKMVDEFLKQIRKKDSMFAKAFVDGLGKAVVSNYRLAVDVGFSEKKD